MKPELEDAILKVTPKAVLVRIVPFFTDDFEGDVLKKRHVPMAKFFAARSHLIGRSSVELQNGEVSIVLAHRLAERERELVVRARERGGHTKLYDGVFVLSIRSG